MIISYLSLYIRSIHNLYSETPHSYIDIDTIGILTDINSNFLCQLSMECIFDKYKTLIIRNVSVEFTCPSVEGLPLIENHFKLFNIDSFYHSNDELLSIMFSSFIIEDNLIINKPHKYFRL